MCASGISASDSGSSSDHGLLTPVLSAHKLDSRLRRVPDVSVDRFFFLVLHEWVTMIAKERVAAFLLAHQPRSFCDECLARALGIDPSTGHRAAVKAGRRGGFCREYGVCSDCGESRLVTRASR